MVLLSVDFSNLHTILESLYNEMMPLCEDMLDVAKGLAGLGALFYVAVRVWQSLARAEPIDVYPLLRPFAIGICIMLFPTLVLGTMNTVLSPIVQGTHKMLEGQTMDMQQYREQKDRLEREAMLRNPETAYLVSDEEFDRQLDELGWSPDAMATRMGMYMEVGMYNLEKNIRDAFRSLLELLFAAASLLIDTVRTFFLVVLSILGPIAFAFSVWDGFQSTLSQWFTRYISVYLWLPVSDLFSCMLAKIQVLMLQNDILELQNELFAGQLQFGICDLHADRYHRIFYRADRGRMDCAGRRCRKLQPQHQPYRDQGRRICSRCRRFRTGKYRRASAWKINRTGT